MQRTGNLFDSMVAFDNLWRAAHRAWRGKKDKIRIAEFYFHLEREILQLQEELIADRYQPRPYRIFLVTEPKHREIASADFRDRVVHHAIVQVLEPLFERRLIYHSYACRVGKGSHAAVRQAQIYAQRFPYFLKCDIRKYFRSVDHATLNHLLVQIIKDRKVLALLSRIIAHPVAGHLPGKGIPIGNLTSQHFANLYLGELDHFIKERLRVVGYLRYMDDFLCFGTTPSYLHGLHFEIRHFLEERLLLSLKEQATLLAPVTEGVPFLGFRIFPGTIRLQRKGVIRLRRKLRARELDYHQGIIDEGLLSRTVGSMIGHLVHADTLALRRQLFSAVG